MTREEAIEKLAAYRAENWDENDTQDALIEGRIGFQEMSNRELEEWCEEWLEESVKIEGKEPVPLSVQYAAQDLLEAVRLAAVMHPYCVTFTQALAKAEGRG